MVKDMNGEKVIATLQTDEVIKPSFKRWLKHVCYFKSSHKFFTTQQQQQIADAIREAEDGHYGEIQIVIEGSLPSHLAYEVNIRQRAEQLFAQYKVWDTEHNSGILIYLNLCEHVVEIVADRGIHQAVQQDCWQETCHKMLPYFKQQQFTEGLCLAINDIGQQFQQFYRNRSPQQIKNELSDFPKLI